LNVERVERRAAGRSVHTASKRFDPCHLSVGSAFSHLFVFWLWLSLGRIPHDCLLVTCALEDSTRVWTRRQAAGRGIDSDPAVYCTFFGLGPKKSSISRSSPSKYTALEGGHASGSTWPTTRYSSPWPRCPGWLGWNALMTGVGMRHRNARR